jgi:hypothetical protein
MEQCIKEKMELKGTNLPTLSFSHQTIPPWALNRGLKQFSIWLRICIENQDNRLKVQIP